MFAAGLQAILSSESAKATPFRISTLIIFLAAIVHTLLAHHFTSLSKKITHKHIGHSKKGVSILGEILYFLGEIEVVFALWVVPLIVILVFFYGWKDMITYLNTRVYVEPFFIVVVMSLASTRPIVDLAEKGVHMIGKFFGDSKASWWFTILTLGPLFGSIITEVAALTIAALLLRKTIYVYSPSKRLAYATMGLMFVNFSVGSILTNFAAPPALILSRCWKWNFLDIFSQFSWRVVLGVFIVNTLYFFLLRKDFNKLKKTSKMEEESIDLEKHKESIPLWITCIHLIFLAWVIGMAHYLPIFLGSYLLFLGFHQATRVYQFPLNLKRPLMVGLFLAGLAIHGGLQEWWIDPLLGNLDYGPMMFIVTILSAFNENTTLAYLACLLEDIKPSIQYALISGIVIGGGLTIMAHAPNPVGQALLRSYFKKGISPWNLFLAAIFPTMIFFVIFYFFNG